MKHLYKILLLLCVILCCSFLPVQTAKAADITQISGLNDNSPKHGKYMQDKYRDNYYLDLEHCGLLDGIYNVFNGIANTLFSMVEFIAYATVCFFYRSLTFDLTSKFSGIINGIQGILKNSVFTPLLYLGFFCSGLTILKRFIQQNMVGILTEFCKVIVLLLLSVLLVKDSSTILRQTSAVTKAISLSAFTGVNALESDADASLQDFAADSACVLWENMLHKPWESLEFGIYGRNMGDNEKNSFLELTPGSEERKAKVEEYNGAGMFSTARTFSRIGNCFIYLFAIIIKGFLYIAVSGLMFVYQIFSVFYLLIAPLVLILAFFPSYQSIVNVWFKKFLETQVCIFMITLVLGLVVKVDGLIFDTAGDFGWFLVLIFQIATIFFLYKERDKLINVFSNIQKAVETPAYANTMLRNRLHAQNVAQNIPKYAQNTYHAAVDTKDALKRAAIKVHYKATAGQREDAATRETMSRLGRQAADSKGFSDRPNLKESMAKWNTPNPQHMGSMQFRMARAQQTIDQIREYEDMQEAVRRRQAARDNADNVVDFGSYTASGNGKRPHTRTTDSFGTQQGNPNISRDSSYTTAERPYMSSTVSPDDHSSSFRQESGEKYAESFSGQNRASDTSVSSNAAASATQQTAPAGQQQQPASRSSTPRHTPGAGGSFTAVEVNVPVSSKIKKEERPRLNTGVYHGTDTPSSSANRKTTNATNAARSGNAAYTTRSRNAAPNIARAKKVK